MTNDERERLERQREQIEARILRIDSMPEEPAIEDDDACVITFNRIICNQPYTYVAVKAAGVWWLSGKGAWWLSGKDRATSWTRWENLMETLDVWGVTEIWLATEWEVL